MMNEMVFPFTSSHDAGVSSTREACHVLKPLFEVDLLLDNPQKAWNRLGFYWNDTFEKSKVKLEEYVYIYEKRKEKKLGV